MIIKRIKGFALILPQAEIFELKMEMDKISVNHFSIELNNWEQVIKYMLWSKSQR